MVYCEKCGSELQQGTKFCVKCGTKVPEYAWNASAIDNNAETQSEVENVQVQTEAQQTEQKVNPVTPEPTPQASTANEEKHFCTNCGAEMNANADFCIKCGVSKNKTKNYCSHCGAKVNPEQDFCVSCGNKLATGLSVGNIKINNEQVDKLAKTTIGKAYVDFWKSWKDYSGKLSRPGYWYALLAFAIICVVLMIVSSILSMIIPFLGELIMIITVIFCIISIAPMISAMVRRTRDAGYHWKYLIFAYLLTGGAILLMILPSNEARK